MIRSVVVDTNIWIDWGRGGYEYQALTPGTVRFLLVAPVLAELEFARAAATTNKRLDESARLIEAAKQASEFVAFDEVAAEEMGYLRAVTARSGKPRAPIDLMIAAIARVRRAEVLTRDASANFGELLALPPRPTA